MKYQYIDINHVYDIWRYCMRHMGMGDLGDDWEDIHRNFHESLEDMQQLGGLRMWILHVLDEEGPKNGVEIMDAVQIQY